MAREQAGGRPGSKRQHCQRRFVVRDAEQQQRRISSMHSESEQACSGGTVAKPSTGAPIGLRTSNWPDPQPHTTGQAAGREAHRSSNNIWETAVM